MKTICEIADAYAAVNAAATAYWDSTLKAQVVACTTLVEYQALCGSVSREAADVEMHMRELPVGISVPLLLAVDRFRRATPSAVESASKASC